MEEHTVKTTLQLAGGEQYRAEVKAICDDFKYLGKCIEAVQKSVAQLNKSFEELIELRKRASL